MKLSKEQEETRAKLKAIGETRRRLKERSVYNSGKQARADSKKQGGPGYGLSLGEAWQDYLSFNPYAWSFNNRPAFEAGWRS